MNGGLVNWMPGFSRYYHGQQYWCRGSETYLSERRDKYVTITVIESRCTACGWLLCVCQLYDGTAFDGNFACRSRRWRC